jgi:hypothetical protein
MQLPATSRIPTTDDTDDGENRLRLTLDDETVEADPGSWVHMPPHFRHSVLALEPSVMLLSMLRGT